MSDVSEEYDRLRRRARELGKKGLDIDQVCERINGLCVFCDPPHRDTVRHWMKHDKKPMKHGGGKPKQRVAASDGRVFESVTQAAEALGVCLQHRASGAQRLEMPRPGNQVQGGLEMAVRNTLMDLSDTLFEQLERLNDASPEEIDMEVTRAKAMSDVAGTIISTANCVVGAMRFKDTAIDASTHLPRLLGGE